MSYERDHEKEMLTIKCNTVKKIAGEICAAVILSSLMVAIAFIFN